MKALGIILAGGNNGAMKDLTSRRAIAAMPLAGTYRAIDFAMSNLSNSGISTIAVITQYSSRSLNQHLSSSKWWDIGRKQGGLFLLNPTITPENNNWYQGTADALIQNLDFLKERHEPYVVIASGDGVYKLDYNKVLNAHIESGAEVTVVCKKMPVSEKSRFGILDLAEDGRIVSWSEKKKEAVGEYVNCGIYVIRRRRLITYLEACRLQEKYDLVRDLLLPVAESGRAFAFRLESYWTNINTIRAYYDCNMDLLDVDLRRFFFHEYPTIHTRVDDYPPAKINPGAELKNTLVASGSIINGSVENSVLFKKVYVGKGSSVKNCILLDDAYIGENVHLENCIVEKKTKIEDGFTMIGKKKDIPVIS